MGVFVTASTTSIAQSSIIREKVQLYELRANNVDYLRHEVACYDWSTVLFCTDIQHIYDVFLATVHMLIDMLTSDKSLSYTDRLQKFGLTTLETRRLRGDLIEVFKMFKGFDNIALNDFFSVIKHNFEGSHS